jgi:glycosyltransferase involved in cell wall biosynthesis
METFAHPTVAVIIPVFDQARFLPDAIMSVLAQTRPADEIIVVDDGSTDDAAAVVAQFLGVRLIRQENRGPSAARNTGFRNCKARYVVFLDADDYLFPTGLEAGLASMAAHPDCALVHGGYRRVWEDGSPPWTYIPSQNKGDAYLAFLRKNHVGAIMTALFRRDCLLAVNGFDEKLRRAEDYDLYLRMARKYLIGSHPEIVGEYRRHDKNVSNDSAALLKATLLILNLHEAPSLSDAHRAALRDGRIFYRNLYNSRMLIAASDRWRASHNVGVLARDLIEAARWAPVLTVRALLGGLGRRAGKVLSRQR